MIFHTKSEKPLVRAPTKSEGVLFRLFYQNHANYWLFVIFTLSIAVAGLFLTVDVPDSVEKCALEKKYQSIVENIKDKASVEALINSKVQSITQTDMPLVSACIGANQSSGELFKVVKGELTVNVVDMADEARLFLALEIAIFAFSLMIFIESNKERNKRVSIESLIGFRSVALASIAGYLLYASLGAISLAFVLLVWGPVNCAWKSGKGAAKKEYIELGVFLGIVVGVLSLVGWNHVQTYVEFVQKVQALWVKQADGPISGHMMFLHAQTVFYIYPLLVLGLLSAFINFGLEKAWELISAVVENFKSAKEDPVEPWRDVIVESEIEALGVLIEKQNIQGALSKSVPEAAEITKRL